MSSALALVLLLTATPGQADGLTLSRVRLTHGVLGPVRKDNQVLPGDSLFISFDIGGVTTGPGGRVRYSTTTEITDGQGRVLFQQPSQDREVANALGGDRLPAFARIDVGLGAPPGEYGVKVTVTDRDGKKSQTLTHKVQVLPKAFAVVGLTTTRDPEGHLPAGLLAPGETLFVNASVVGFGRGAGPEGQPHVALALRILDASGKPTLSEPFTGAVNKDVAAAAVALPVQFVVGLNRPGKFTAELTATDKVANKTSTLSFPVTVHAAQ
jgi:hypothetical protein